MGRDRRGNKEWENHFICVTDFMGTMDKHVGNDSLIECFATRLRNPVVFDNNVESVKNRVPYSVAGLNGKLTEDHLIGTSNMVLYIFKKGLHRKWENVSDFMKTLKALNVLITVTKEVNDCKEFKGDWKFNYTNIDDCIKWNLKLKSVGINTLICDETSEVVSVDTVWNKWFTENKEFLT